MHGWGKMEYAENSAFHRWASEVDETTVRCFYLGRIHEHHAIQLIPEDPLGKESRRLTAISRPTYTLCESL